MKALGLLLILISLSVWSNDGFIKGEGRFYSEDEDRLSFVKNQLKYKAYRDVITKEMKSMGLETELFWETYDTKFQEKFSLIEEKIREKFEPKKEGEVMDRKTKEKLQKTLRYRRLQELAKYMNISRAIKSYAIRKISRSPQYPKSRYMRIEAKVDRNVLNTLFFEVTQGKVEKLVKRFFLSVDYHVENQDWAALGVSASTDFTEVVNEHWKKWLSEKSGIQFESVEIVDAALEDQIQEHLKISTFAQDHTDFKQIQGDSRLPYGVTNFQGSMWLRVNINITPGEVDNLLHRRAFKIDGDGVLFDLGMNKPVWYFNLNPEETSFSLIDQHKLSSDLASLLYRRPLSELGQLKEHIDAIPSHVSTRKIQIINHRNIQEIYEIEKILRSKGLILRTEVENESISLDRAFLTLKFQGSEEKLFAILRGLENYKLNSERKIFFPNLENLYTISLSNLGGSSDGP